MSEVTIKKHLQVKDLSEYARVNKNIIDDNNELEEQLYKVGYYYFITPNKYTFVTGIKNGNHQYDDVEIAKWKKQYESDLKLTNILLIKWMLYERYLKSNLLEILIENYGEENNDIINGIKEKMNKWKTQEVNNFKKEGKTEETINTLKKVIDKLLEELVTNNNVYFIIHDMNFKQIVILCSIYTKMNQKKLNNLRILRNNLAHGKTSRQYLIIKHHEKHYDPYKLVDKRYGTIKRLVNEANKITNDNQDLDEELNELEVFKNKYIKILRMKEKTP